MVLIADTMVPFIEFWLQKQEKTRVLARRIIIYAHHNIG